MRQPTRSLCSYARYSPRRSPVRGQQSSDAHFNPARPRRCIAGKTKGVGRVGRVRTAYVPADFVFDLVFLLGTDRVFPVVQVNRPDFVRVTPVLRRVKGGYKHESAVLTIREGESHTMTHLNHGPRSPCCMLQV